jgi:hypothetical protein
MTSCADICRLHNRQSRIATLRYATIAMPQTPIGLDASKLYDTVFSPHDLP